LALAQNHYYVGRRFLIRFESAAPELRRFVAWTAWFERNPTMISKRLISTIYLAVALAGWWPATAGEITTSGRQLAEVLDSMHVERLWLAGGSVDWRTGEPKGNPYTNSTTHTHCSAFAAAAAERLGVYLLHPPEHSSVLLANAQQDWLRTNGVSQGWYAVASPIKAQQLANEGRLVVVTCKNPREGLPGHVAIVRPSVRSEAEILAEGPAIIQAGARNYVSTTCKEGFKHHPGAFENNQLLYFAHAIPSAIFAQGQAISPPQEAQAAP
jgi:hypothetical protein